MGQLQRMAWIIYAKSLCGRSGFKVHAPDDFLEKDELIVC